MSSPWPSVSILEKHELLWESPEVLSTKWLAWDPNCRSYDWFVSSAPELTQKDLHIALPITPHLWWTQTWPSHGWFHPIKWKQWQLSWPLQTRASHQHAGQQCFQKTKYAKAYCGHLLKICVTLGDKRIAFQRHSLYTEMIHATAFIPVQLHHQNNTRPLFREAITFPH